MYESNLIQINVIPIYQHQPDAINVILIKGACEVHPRNWLPINLKLVNVWHVDHV